MRNLLILIFVSSSFLNAYSQGIEGTVKNTSGKPVAYATIYAQQVSKGTTSNLDGRYKLMLPEGDYKLTIRYLGYKTKQIEVSCKNDFKTLDIVMEEQAYKIPEVRILASGEDPAYSIMRKAIAMSYYYQNQVEEYKCRTYIKGSGKFTKIPRLLRKSLKEEDIEEGKPIILENITDIHFKLPDVLDQNTISLRSTMDLAEIAPMDYLAFSLYNDGEYSPLGKNAFTHYKFQLVSSFYDQDYLVHKIKVIPRKVGFEFVSGHLSIVEGFWHLHSTEMSTEQNMVAIEYKQIYSPVGNDIWMPVSFEMDIDAKLVGFEFTGKYVTSVSDYEVKLNTKLDHSVYKSMLAGSKEYVSQANQINKLVQKEDLTNKESKKLKKLIKEDVKKSVPKKKLELTDNNSIEDSAKLRTVVYWDSIRPVPLTIEEIGSYKVRDSVQLRMESDTTFKDSVEREDSRFKWGKVFTGGTFNYKNGHSFRYGGIVDLGSVNFNTVDGLKYGMKFRYRHNKDSGKYFRVNHEAYYAFSRERMTSNISLYYRYNGMKRASISLNGGRTTSDFDSETGISENLNLITTLFLKENFLKLYQKDYTELIHKTDISNGLNLLVGFEYAQRKELSNYSDFNIYNPYKKDYTSNIPENPDNILVVSHTASLVEIGLEYTPEYYYRVNKGVKRMSYSNYPTFGINYKKGIKSLLDSDADFDRLELSINQQIQVRRIGELNYKLTGGSFLNSNNMYFADYKHFGTNTPFLIGSSQGSMLRLPQYYDYSTAKNYFEANVQILNGRMLLKRLPILNKTLMQEALYFNYLSAERRKPYYEIGYGLNQVFLLFNFEIFTGFEGAEHKYTGIKIGIPFFGNNGTSISIGG